MHARTTRIFAAVATSLAIAGGSIGIAAATASSGRSAGGTHVGGSAKHGGHGSGTRSHTSLGETVTQRPGQTVDQGLGQLTAPPSWQVQAQLGCAMTIVDKSTLFVNVMPSVSKSCLPAIKPANSIVWMYEPNVTVTGKPVLVVNGFRLYSFSEGGVKGYVAPQLDLAVLWKGAYPKDLIHTLSWSPVHYLLTAGATPPPPSWTRQFYDGLSVAAPPTWAVKRPLTLACSGPFDHGPVVGLGVKVIPLPCAYSPPPTLPTDGVLITKSDQLSSCPIHGTIKVGGQQVRLCSDPNVQPPEAEVRIVLGAGSTSDTVYVTVGLGSNYQVASEILGSIETVVPVGAAS
jgi:hypothetical protein